MAKKLHTILITIVCTIVCIAIYDKFKAKQIQRIDYDIAKLVAHKDQNSDNVIKTKRFY